MFGGTQVHLLSPGSPGWDAGVGPSLHLSFPAASPQPAVRVPVTSAQGSLPPSEAGVPTSPTTHPSMPPRADVAVPESCLHGEREARLMCDETELSEPLRGSGSNGVEEFEEGYREGYINQHRLQGLGYPHTGGQKSQEETRRNKERGRQDKKKINKR